MESGTDTLTSEPAYPYRGADGRLDLNSVIRAMTDACPGLERLLKRDHDTIGGLPYLDMSWIAKALVDFCRKGDTSCARAVLPILESVLRDFGQKGRDFVGAGFVEGIPDGGDSVLAPLAGPLLYELMGPYMESAAAITRLQLLWIDNWLDGPISGVVRYKEQEHRFEAVWDVRTDDWLHPRRFWLFEMSRKERLTAWQRHRLFEEKVGTVYCFHVGVSKGITRPASSHKEFYDRYPRKQGPGAYPSPTIGWFDEAVLGNPRPHRPVQSL